MAKHSRKYSSKHSRKHCKRHHTRKNRNYKGGNYTSASTYGSYVNGSGNDQFARTFDSGGNYGNRYGSEYIGAQGQSSHLSGIPNQQNLTLVQSAGKKKYVSKFEPGFNFNFKTSKTSFLRKKHRRKS
jgi:hypothetical protein